MGDEIIVSRCCPSNCVGLGAKNTTPYLEIDCATCKAQYAQEIREKLEKEFIDIPIRDNLPIGLNLKLKDYSYKEWQQFWQEVQKC